MTSSKSFYITMAELKSRLIDFEKESAETYSSLRSLTDDDNASSILELLMKEEEEHAKKLERLPIGGPAPGFVQFPPEISLSMPSIPDNKDLESMLSYAIEREAQSSRIYTNTAAQTSGAFKDLFTDLAAWEGRHEERVKQLKIELTGGT